MPKNPIEMDDFTRARDELPSIALRLAEEFGTIVHERFFREPVEPFTAYYGDRAVHSAD